MLAFRVERNGILRPIEFIDQIPRRAIVKGMAVSLIAMGAGGCGTVSKTSAVGRTLVALKEVLDGFSHLVDAMFSAEKTDVASNNGGNNIILSGALSSNQGSSGNIGAIIADRRDADKLYESGSNQVSIVPVFKGQGPIQVAKKDWTPFSIKDPGLKPGDYAIALYTERDRLL